MSKYMITNLVDTQQAVEYGRNGDIDTTTIIPARSRIILELQEEKANELREQFHNILAIRKM